MTPPKGSDSSESVSDMARSMSSISMNDAVKRTLRVVEAEDEVRKIPYVKFLPQKTFAHLLLFYYYALSS